MCLMQDHVFIDNNKFISHYLIMLIYVQVKNYLTLYSVK